MASRLTNILTVLVLAALLHPVVAAADGDPASDVLLGQNVFYPYMPPVSASAQKTLNAETAAAKRAGFPLKVALIASPVDLGVIPDLFNKPQKYADFLDQEISFQGKQLLLVVMPAGYGVQGFGGPAKAAVGTLPLPAGKTSNDLARAAITAVAKLATASGRKLTGTPGVPGTAAAKSATSSTTPIVIGLVVAAGVTAGALIVLRRRQAPRRPRRAGRPR